MPFLDGSGALVDAVGDAAARRQHQGTQTPLASAERGGGCAA